jgi:hypothetical protein
MATFEFEILSEQMKTFMISFQGKLTNFVLNETFTKESKAFLFEAIEMGKQIHLLQESNNILTSENYNAFPNLYTASADIYSILKDASNDLENFKDLQNAISEGLNEKCILSCGWRSCK